MSILPLEKAPLAVKIQSKENTVPQCSAYGCVRKKVRINAKLIYVNLMSSGNESKL